MNEVHIPSVSGAINIVGVSVNSNAKKSRLSGLLSQEGTNDPTMVVFENEIGSFALSRFAVGQYQLTNANLSVNDTLVFLQNTSGTDQEFSVEIDEGGGLVNIFSGEVGVGDADDLIFNTPFVVELVRDISTDYEAIFNDILSALDDIQKTLWVKIIVRSNNVVTEVDGDTYRKTNDFASSSKVINS